MLVPVERLLLKLRQPATRADELIALRRRVRDELACDVDTEERELAAAVQAQKRAVTARLQAVRSCGSCAAREPWPVGGYDGGACCSGVTGDLFDDDELAALVQAGTRVRHLVPPARADHHAGCAFRGARGCSLATDHRPARCVHYVCNTLRRELHTRGELDAIERELAALDRAMQRFAAVHRARREREVLAPLLAALASATAKSRR